MIENRRCTIRDRKRAADLVAVRAGHVSRTQEDIETVGRMSDVEVLEFIKADNDITPAAVEVEEIRPGAAADPDELFNLCDDLIKNIMNKYNLDDKMSPLQWRFVCSRVGAWFRARSAFRIEQINCIASNNIKQIDIDAAAAAVPVWVQLCTLYNKTPLISDFCAFVGLSQEYLYKSGSGVTPDGIQLLQKLQQIQADGLRARVLNPRESPVGAIFLLKADHGLVEATKVTHEYIKTDETGAALPDFGSFSELPDKNG